jgi:hypothetical protein
LFILRHAIKAEVTFLYTFFKLLFCLRHSYGSHNELLVFLNLLKPTNLPVCHAWIKDFPFMGAYICVAKFITPLNLSKVYA